MNIPVVDKTGKVWVEIPSELFPINIPLKVIWGKKTYELTLIPQREKDTRKVIPDKLRGLSLSVKDPD